VEITSARWVPSGGGTVRVAVDWAGAACGPPAGHGGNGVLPHAASSAAAATAPRRQAARGRVADE